MEKRRSSRVRQSRYIERDGHRILKLNDYSLQSGERSVYDVEARSEATTSTVVPIKSAWSLFLADYHAGKLRKYAIHGGEGGESMQTSQQRASILWNTTFGPGTRFRELYEKKSRDLKRQNEESRELARKQAKLRQERERQLQKQAQDEAEKRREEIMKKERQRRAKSEKRRAERKAREAAGIDVMTEQNLNPQELFRRRHNNAMKKRKESQERYRMEFFGARKHVLEGFVDPKVLKSLPSTKTRQDDENNSIVDVEVDTEGAPLVSQPDAIVSGTMRRYQLKGLEWLLWMYDHNMSPILGDEMGLGKTLQTISFLAALKFNRGVSGPFLVVVPLSVLSSWMNEFRKWCPSLRVVRLHSQDKQERERLRKHVLSDLQSFDVIVTTYEYVVVPEMRATLASRIYWRVVILDEGHKVKNENAIISQAVRRIRSEIVILLTGTPLQNNLSELWALLNYLYPKVFTIQGKEFFSNAFELNGASDTGIQIDRDKLGRAHYLLRPLMLRRLKIEVEKLLPRRLETKVMCPLSPMQIFWYKRLLLRDSKLLERVEAQAKSTALIHSSTTTDDDDGQENGSGDWKRLQSLLMQLRKCCNHPFLFPNAEAAVQVAAQKNGESWDGRCNESIVDASGKMRTLDILLRRLKLKGHRVVIFSQFTRMLDIIDDYLNMRGYAFARLDGSTNRVQRMIHIQEFNKKDSPYFCFIMSTRAGGMGINLQTADTVILMDSDWNPQVDMQAMARVHRIGQKSTVHVYRLISQGTMEERVVQRAQKKLFLDAMVNRGSTAGGMKRDKMDSKAMLETLSFGMDRVFNQSSDVALTEDDIDRIIDRMFLKTFSLLTYPPSHPPAQQLTGTRTDSEIELKSLSSAKQTASTFDESSSLVALRHFQGHTMGGRDDDQDEEEEEEEELQTKKRGRRKKKKKTKKRENYRGIADAWIEQIASTGSSRKRKTRFVQIDGHTVLKQNMYSMSQGEPSVFEQESSLNKKKKPKVRSFQTFKGRQVAGRDYDHQKFCQSCLESGDLIMCDRCPCAYHLSCLGLTEKDMKAFTFGWSCPHHSCKICGRKAAAVGGLIFRCEMCPTAYCEDHLPNTARERITNKCKRFISLGQYHPKQACFLLCSKECETYHKITKGGTDVDSMYDNSGEGDSITSATSYNVIDVLKRNNITRTAFAEKISKAVGSELTEQTVKQYISAYTHNRPVAKNFGSIIPRVLSSLNEADRIASSSSSSFATSTSTTVTYRKGELVEALWMSGKDPEYSGWWPAEILGTVTAEDLDDIVAVKYIDGTVDDEVPVRDVRRPINAQVARRERTSTTSSTKKSPSKVMPPSLPKMLKQQERNDWDRISINCKHQNCATQMRFVASLLSGFAPCKLGDIPGIRQRIVDAPDIVTNAMHSVLYGRVPGPDGVVKEILNWKGACNQMSGFNNFNTKDLRRICKSDKLVQKASFPRKGLRTTSASNFATFSKEHDETLRFELDTYQNRLALGSTYLRIVRVLQLKGEDRVVPSYVLKKMLVLLGLSPLNKARTDMIVNTSRSDVEVLNPIARETESTVGLSQDIRAEILATFLTFPGPGLLQHFGAEYFAPNFYERCRLREGGHITLKPTVLLSVADDNEKDDLADDWHYNRRAKIEKTNVASQRIVRLLAHRLALHMAELRLKIDQKKQEEEQLRRKQDKKRREHDANQKRSIVKLMRQLEFLRQKGWSCKCRKTTRGSRAGQTEVMFTHGTFETECLKTALLHASSSVSHSSLKSKKKKDKDQNEDTKSFESVSVAVRVPDNFKINKTSQHALIRYENRDALVPLPIDSGLIPGGMVMIRLCAEHFEYKTKNKKKTSYKTSSSVLKNSSPPPELSSVLLKDIPKLELRKDQRETLYALNLDARLDWRVGQFRLETQDVSWRLVGFPVPGFDPEAEAEALLREEKIQAEEDRARIKAEEEQNAKMRPLLDRLDRVGWTITTFSEKLGIHPNYVRWYINGQSLDWPRVKHATRMIASWMRVVDVLSRALSQIECDKVFSCEDLSDACVRDERKNEILAARFATRPEELASLLRSEIGFTISRDVMDVVLREELNEVEEEEEEEEKKEEGEEDKMDVDEALTQEIVDNASTQIVGDASTQDKINTTTLAEVDTLQEKESNTWICKKCTLKNEVTELFCVACGQSKSRTTTSSTNMTTTTTSSSNQQTQNESSHITEATNAALAKSCMEPHWTIVFDEEKQDALWECEEDDLTSLKIAKKFGLPSLSSLITALNRKQFPEITERSKFRIGTKLMIPWVPISLDRRLRRLGWGRLITTNIALSIKCDGPKKFFWAQCDIETCGKWRRLPISRKPHVDSATKWTCNMNVSDRKRNSCDAEEENYETEPSVVAQLCYSAEELFDTAKKCLAYVTGASSKNVTHWMKSSIVHPVYEMSPLDAEIDSLVRIWMDGMNRADVMLSKFYAQHVPELETISEVVVSEWNYVLDEFALERLNAALWKRHGKGFFTNVSQDVLREADLEKSNLTSLLDGTDFEDVIMTRKKNLDLIRLTHEAMGWNGLKKNNRWDVCKKIAKKMDRTIGNVWNLLTNRVHRCKASTSYEMRTICRRLEMLLNSVEKCVHSVARFLEKYDQQLQDGDHDFRAAARSFLLDLDFEIEDWTKDMSETVLSEHFMLHANVRMWQRYGACLVNGEQFSRSVPMSIEKDDEAYKLPTVCPLTRDETKAVERGLVKKLGIRAQVQCVLATSRGVPLKSSSTSSSSSSKRKSETSSKNTWKKRRVGEEKKTY